MQYVLVAKTFLTDEKGRILVLHRSSTDPTRPGGPDLPGGWVEDGEDTALAAIREIQEEAGVLIDRGALYPVYASANITPEASPWNIVRIFYTAQISPGDEVVLSHEHDAFEWLSEAEAVKTLVHPPQAAALGYALENGLLAGHSS